MVQADTSGLRQAARIAIESKGADAVSIIGRGRPENTFFQLSGAYNGSCAVRTAKHGWFAFPWNKDHWGTLRDCDFVLVATADNEDRPSAIDVHFFEASDLRKAFDEARESKLAAGLKVSDWTGLWIALHDDPDAPRRSGAAKLAKWTVRQPLNGTEEPAPVAVTARPAPTVGLNIAEAKRQLAAHYGVDVAAIEIVIRG